MAFDRALAQNETRLLAEQGEDIRLLGANRPPALLAVWIAAYTGVQTFIDMIFQCQANPADDVLHFCATALPMGFGLAGAYENGDATYLQFVRNIGLDDSLHSALLESLVETMDAAIDPIVEKIVQSEGDSGYSIMALLAGALLYFRQLEQRNFPTGTAFRRWLSSIESRVSVVQFSVARQVGGSGGVILPSQGPSGSSRDSAGQ